jgi:7,8-dihydropterin-6-yl-methyl-4-(beta-D-ribofuranosyl)aminobenzene 5'-phosphate synthase
MSGINRLDKKCSITILVENTVCEQGLAAEHGWAVWIEYGTYKVLFDTGQSSLLIKNAEHLGVDITKTDTIVLSHGHYDHTGGLKSVLEIAAKPKVIIHPDGFNEKYTCPPGGIKRKIGISELDEAAVRELARELIYNKKPLEIYPGLWATGEIPRCTEYEDVGGSFYLDGNRHKKDPLLDDQALFIETTKGLVVFFGCVHVGVINTLRYIRELTGNKKIHVVLGGMHLLNASEKRMGETIKVFRDMNIDYIGPGHCSGQVASAMMWRAFQKKCISCAAGKRFEFELI